MSSKEALRRRSNGAKSECMRKKRINGGLSAQPLAHKTGSDLISQTCSLRRLCAKAILLSTKHLQRANSLNRLSVRQNRVHSSPAKRPPHQSFLRSKTSTQSLQKGTYQISSSSEGCNQHRRISLPAFQHSWQAGRPQRTPKSEVCISNC